MIVAQMERKPVMSDPSPELLTGAALRCNTAAGTSARESDSEQASLLWSEPGAVLATLADEANDERRLPPAALRHAWIVASCAAGT